MHSVRTSIESLDISPQRSHAVLAGRDVLKTVRIDGVSCVEDFDIRASIIARASAKNASVDAVSAQYREQLSAVDVKWSNGRFEHSIATAASSGRIVTYDLQRAGVETGRCHEHERQVHRLAFNPHEGSRLLSGSQDGTTRLWDLRQWTQRSVSIFDGKNEGVRDVRWSIADGFEFAVGTSNGVIQRWDIRKPKTPVIKINAHDSTCFAIDWHPAGRYLASAGADKNVKIWDFSSSDRRMKPTTVLRAPQPIRKVRWRYPSGSVARSDAASQCTQIATVYTDKDPRIHVWDFSRPHSFYQEIDRYKTPASDILWHSSDILWSVGEAGMFTQTDMRFASIPRERSNIDILDVSPDGEMCFFTQINLQKPTSDGSLEFLRGINMGDSSGEHFSGSQRGKESGSFEETETLHPPLRLHRERSASARSTVRTPPTNSINNTFEEVAKAPSQSPAKMAVFGQVVGNFDVEGFEYLARKYKSPLRLHELNTSSAIHKELRIIFEHNAERAHCAGEFRAAQTWKILGEALEIELEARAQEASKRHTKDGSNHLSIYSKEREVVKLSSPSSKMSQPHKPRPVSSTLSNLETSSQATTPLIRPSTELPRVPSSAIFSPSPKPALAAPIILAPGSKLNESSLETASRNNSPEYDGYSYYSSPQLSPNATRDAERQTSIPGGPLLPEPPISIETSPVTDSNIEDEAEQRRAKMENYRAAPRPILHLDSGLNLQPSIAPHLLRHDSSDSFNINMFSTSTDSSHKALSLGDSFGESQESSSPVATRRWNAKLSRGFSIDRDSSEGEVPKAMSSALDYSSSHQDPPEKLQGLELSQMATPPDLLDQNVSGVAVISRPVSLSRPTTLPRPIVHDLPPSPPASPQLQTQLSRHPPGTSTHLPEYFFPTPTSDASTFPTPWTFSALLPQIIEYYLDSLVAPQIPTFLILYLAPLFPTLLPAPEKILSILHGYHALLTSFDLYIPATRLRKTCHDIFPDWDVFPAPKDQAPTSRSFVPWCPICNAPLLLPDAESRSLPDLPNDIICQRCHLHSPICPVCNTISEPLAPSIQPTRDSYNEPLSFPLGPDKMWRLCPTCQHAAHASCLTAWWDGGEDHGSGLCPWSGCGCPCVLGEARTKFDDKRKGERKVNKGRGGTGARRGSNLGGKVDTGGRSGEGEKLQDDDAPGKDDQHVPVKRDGWVVQDTPAVEGARGVLKGSEGRGGSSAARRSGGRRGRGARGSRGQERRRSGRGVE